MSANAPHAAPEQRPPTRAFPKPVLIVAALVVVGVGGWLFLRARHPEPDRFTGYVVSDNLYMAAPVAGTILKVAVARGDRVQAGATLFSLDPTSLGARADQARAQISEAAAQTAEAQADLGRAQASLRGAEAEVKKAQEDLARLTAAQAEKAGAVAPIQIDQARAALTNAQAQRDGARTQAQGAQSRIAAARAQVEGQRANLTAAQRQVTDLAPVAPVAARVEEVMYDPGEWAAANTPVVSLVPDDKVKVRFYVPQDRVNLFRPGTAVTLACDGCAKGLTGKVQFVATRPEYTPPVIYSLETRDRLVFMVEALPSQPRQLVPGQPTDVGLQGDARRASKP
jgi:HlyD family secretion protein